MVAIPVPDREEDIRDSSPGRLQPDLRRRSSFFLLTYCEILDLVCMCESADEFNLQDPENNWRPIPSRFRCSSSCPPHFHWVKAVTCYTKAKKVLKSQKALLKLWRPGQLLGLPATLFLDDYLYYRFFFSLKLM